MEPLRAGLVLVLLLGPLLWLHRTSRLAAGWHPVIVLSSWSLIVLLGGLGGALSVGVAVVAATGIALLLHELIRHRRAAREALREPAVWTFVATAGGLLALVHGQLFVHSDNFSHWALVVRVMLTTGGLPTLDQPVVVFTDYPLGAASLVYAVARLVGPADGVAAWGQALWSVSCALPLVSAAGRRWRAGIGLYAVGAVLMLMLITTPMSLLVDSLVGGLGACLLLLVLLHRERLAAQPWPFAVVAAALLMVKASGAFFVAVASVLLVAHLWRHRTGVGRARLAGWGATLAAPWLMWSLWSLHVAHTFPHRESKHSVSLQRFETVAGEKTPADVRAILGSLTRATLQDWRVLLLVAALLVAVWLAVRVGALSRADARLMVGLAVVVTLLWVVSLGLMYVLSMPLREALALAGLRRYIGTLHLVLILLVLTAVASAIGRARTWTPHAVTAAVLALALPVGLAVVSLPNAREATAGVPIRVQVEQALQQARATSQDRVCLLLSAPDHSYRAWITRYLLLSPTPSSLVLPDDARALPRGQRCDVVVLDDSRASTAQGVRRAGFDLPPDPILPMGLRR